MQITNIGERAVALHSSLANSSIDFSGKTSVMPVLTDLLRDGKPVTGFAFNSLGGFADAAKADDGLPALSDRPRIGFGGQSAILAMMRELAE